MCSTKFVTNYDTKVNKRCNKSKIIHWVSFNQHECQENHYKELLFLFKSFQKSEFHLQNNYDSWKYVYMEQKNDIKNEFFKNIILTHPTILILNGTIKITS